MRPVKVGLDLREVRPPSGGIRPLLRGVLNALVRDPTGDMFHIFQSDGDLPMVKWRTGGGRGGPRSRSTPQRG